MAEQQAAGLPIRNIKHVNLTDVVRRVRDSHTAVIEGIATSAEKHRLEMNAKRDKLRADQALMQGSGNGY